MYTYRAYGLDAGEEATKKKGLSLGLRVRGRFWFGGSIGGLGFRQRPQTKKLRIQGLGWLGVYVKFKIQNKENKGFRACYTFWSRV